MGRERNKETSPLDARGVRPELAARMILLCEGRRTRKMASQSAAPSIPSHQRGLLASVPPPPLRNVGSGIPHAYAGQKGSSLCDASLKHSHFAARGVWLQKSYHHLASDQKPALKRGRLKPHLIKFGSGETSRTCRLFERYWGQVIVWL
jgi:hypothetical protein